MKYLKLKVALWLYSMLALSQCKSLTVRIVETYDDEAFLYIRKVHRCRLDKLWNYMS